MARKTVSVELVRERANHYLRSGMPHDGGQLERVGVASLLETILHATGNYRGFSYCEPFDETTDRTRRQYL